MATMDANGAPPRGSTRLFTPNKNKKKRIRVFTPDDRASHRVIEKQRREALNERFIQLARLLPGLASHHRLSKSIIVNESIAHHKKQRAERLAAAREIRCFLAEREDLLAEVNSWRTRFGPIGAELRQGQPLSENARDLLKVEDEVFGKFPNGFGDNRPSDEEAESYHDAGEITGGPSLTDTPEVQHESTTYGQSLSSRLDAVALRPEDAVMPPRIENSRSEFAAPSNNPQPNNDPASHDLGAAVPGYLLPSFGTEERPVMHQAAVPLGVDDLWELLGPNPQLDMNPALGEPRTMHDGTRNSVGLNNQLYF
ncbi:hypothetical protein B0J12DRAFT_429662 [Macrophomina phaseolina]|uniref:BHLH domain-containing protein n=1 Tax=Macrophomina phaseolina TaxID=35725 RepID=A0ABQ8GH05_9PEZI|nr:hypothetical protein B0J12DRAFT_429662 [Macrophomina phaseolina]